MCPPVSLSLAVFQTQLVKNFDDVNKRSNCVAFHVTLSSLSFNHVIGVDLSQARARRLPLAKYRNSHPEPERVLRFFLAWRYSRRNWLKILAS